jgi:hypothetical protein
LFLQREAISFIFGRNFLRFYSVFQKHIEKLLLAFLVLSCTSFLIVESARTLAAIEGAGALWKALLCEFVLVGVSMLTVSTRKMQYLRSVVLVGIVALSLLNTIGGPLTHFSQARQSLEDGGERYSQSDHRTKANASCTVLSSSPNLRS